jgi:HK97 family phage portal protein
MNFDLTRALARQAEGKALGAHPAFMGHEPVATYSPGSPRTEALISQREATRHAEAYGGDQAIDWLYDCVGLYVDPASTAPYALSREDGTKLVRHKTDGTPPEYEVGPAEVYKLLDKPNPFMLYDELLSLLVIDLMLVGNGYWFKYNWGTPAAALYRLAPSHVKIKPGPYGPEGYQYQPPGAPKPLLINPENIVHFRRPNPHSQWYGMGVVQGGGRAFDLELAITETMSSYYENKADPSLIVQSERRVPRDVFNKLRAQLRARVSGAPNAGELLVLEAGLKASSLSTSASDALFDKLGQMSRNRVYSKFRASPMLFGGQGAGADKVSDARREFDNHALRPFLERIGRLVTASITSEFGCVYKIDHRQILPPEEAIKVGESVARLPGVKVREVRRQYEQFGIEESTGDADIDNLVINVPGQELNANGQGGLADQPLGGEPGRPPLVKNTAAFGVAGAKVRAGKALGIGEIEERLVQLAEGKAEPGSTRLPGERRPDDGFATARKVDLDGLAASVEADLRDASIALERALLDHVEGKALKTSDLVARVRNSDAWRIFKGRITEILEDGARRAAASGVMHSGLAPEEDVNYDDLIESVVHRDDGVRAIVRTFRDRVVNSIKEARAANAERHDFEAAVRAAVKAWGDSQAATVADTEMVHAYNEATLTAAELSGVEKVYVADGEDHDEPCKEANGQVWKISEARSNRLEHPRCRRAFLPLTAEALA